ncbi:ABC transporter permease [Gordonia sp. (in: high G+C Gram-positive bacteria)]|uniref:ABC transporter permease n=1 Tax=Gordonia sp. (in: high G+C Gram-positive bacteria) TaxID=84139 RepID=UPI003C758238
MTASAFAAAVTRWPLLARMDVRRERIITPVTVVLFVAIGLSTGATIAAMEGDPAQAISLRVAAGTNAAFKFLLGNVPQSESLAALTSWRAGLFMIAALGVCAAMTVVRLTRKEEEAGRTELVLAGAVGSVAPVVAAVSVAIGFVLVTSAAMAATLLIAPGGDFVSLLAVFAQYASTGVAAVGLALVAAEVFPNSSIANRAASGVVMAGYVLRGVADTVDGLGWLRWTSPIGWAEEIAPFDKNNFWPALASVGMLAVGLAVAAAVRRRRDLGGGLVADRAGRATAPGLRSTFALAWRLDCSTIASWAIGIASYGVIVGIVTNQVEALAGTNQTVTDFLKSAGTNGTLTQIFLSTMTAFLVVASVGAGVSLLTRWRSEETSGRMEMLLANPVSRSRYFAAQTTMIGVAVLVALIAAPAAIVLGAGLSGVGWATSAQTAFGVAAASIPAVAATMMLAVACFAYRGRLAVVGWPLLLASWLLGPFGTMLGLPQWVRDISPFTHVPMIPLQPVTVLPLLVPAVVAAVFGMLAWRWWNRRDLG